MRIEINGLKKHFKNQNVIDIDELKIEDGQIIGLVGNNGAGKTTLFRLILDLLKSDEGSILLSPKANTTDDTGIERIINPAMSEEWKQYTGSYIDDGFLIDFLTPEEYFSFIGKVCGIDKDNLDKRLNSFEHFMNGEIIGHKKLIRNLSAGNKQKVGIIAALLNKPQLVILDEPFNFIDPSSQNILRETLTSYNRETGATIIISSHNLSHTIDICPRIILLEHGKIIKDLQNTEHSAKEELEEYFKS
jgi:ABC-2 type transport system ATP-binding protein